MKTQTAANPLRFVRYKLCFHCAICDYDQKKISVMRPNAKDAFTVTWETVIDLPERSMDQMVRIL